MIELTQYEKQELMTHTIHESMRIKNAPQVRDLYRLNFAKVMQGRLSLVEWAGENKHNREEERNVIDELFNNIFNA